MKTFCVNFNSFDVISNSLCTYHNLFNFTSNKNEV